MAPRDVNYKIRVVGKLPERAARRSEIEDGIKFVRENVEPGDATVIGDYKNRTAAAAAVNVARKRHGHPTANGLHFQVGADPDDETRHAVFVVYNPAWVTAEGQAQHAANLEKMSQDKLAKASLKREEKAKAKANGSGTPAKTEATAKK